MKIHLKQQHILEQSNSFTIYRIGNHFDSYAFTKSITKCDCRVPFCQFGRKLWRHIDACTKTKEVGLCSVPYCRISREMLKHWEICSKSQRFCRMCTPLRTARKRKRPSKKVQVPNCRASRELVRHYKECSSKDSCPKCKIPNYLKGKMNGLRTIPKKRHSMLLKHACRCHDRTCRNPMCIKLKRAAIHCSVCQTECSESTVCREISIFCLQHTIACTEKDCILTSAVDSTDNNWSNFNWE